MKKCLALVLLVASISQMQGQLISPPTQRIPAPGITRPNPYYGGITFRNVDNQGWTATDNTGYVYVNVADVDVKCINSKNQQVKVNSDGSFNAVVGYRYYFTVCFKKPLPKGFLVSLTVTF